MHIAFTMVWLLLTILAISAGAATFRGRFRLYSIATLVIFLAFGALTGMNGPRIAADLPTPWVGLWERVNIGAYLLWLVVLATTLLRVPAGCPAAAPPRPSDELATPEKE